MEIPSLFTLTTHARPRLSLQPTTTFSRPPSDQLNLTKLVGHIICEFKRLHAPGFCRGGTCGTADITMVGHMFFKQVRDEIDSMMARDPAARSRLEVVLAYPGFQALMFYRLAHWFWRHNWLLTGRFVAPCGRILTAIDIHPGAVIGRRLFIDHGIGLVIGETAEIGDDVTLYQGVTLGGVAPSVNSAAQVHRKRHPTLRNGVIVGSGAQVLGPITVGEGARVGANAVVVADVPPGVTV